jgi:hypothetical protein
MTSRRWIPVLALLALVALPGVAHACPVCFDPRDQNRAAFVTTALALTFLPLGMVGGVGVWLRKRLRRIEDDGDDERSPDAETH